MNFEEARHLQELTDKFQALSTACEQMLTRINELDERVTRTLNHEVGEPAERPSIFKRGPGRP
ncbi:MAG: hypothetical protein KGN37_17390, partial [Burkholderiales bacterium]|nr:hypothetical protein [Burkholderiales bacterium]